MASLTLFLRGHKHRPFLHRCMICTRWYVQHWQAGGTFFVCVHPAPLSTINETKFRNSTQNQHWSIKKTKSLKKTSFLFWSLLPDIGLNKTCFEKAKSIIVIWTEEEKKDSFQFYLLTEFAPSNKIKVKENLHESVKFRTSVGATVKCHAKFKTSFLRGFPGKPSNN